MCVEICFQVRSSNVFFFYHLCARLVLGLHSSGMSGVECLKLRCLGTKYFCALVL